MQIFLPISFCRRKPPAVFEASDKLDCWWKKHEKFTWEKVRREITIKLNICKKAEKILP